MILHMVFSSNKADIGFQLEENGYHKKVFTAVLVTGEWPEDSELLELADGGGEYAAYFGGLVEVLPDHNKRVTVFTD